MPRFGQLDIDVITFDTAEGISAIVELAAAPLPGAAGSAPTTHVVVLDRSGSMDDGRLEVAKEGLEAFVDRLGAGHNFGLVAFDAGVDVVIPAGRVRDKEEVQHAIRGLQIGAMTNLSGGMLRGIQEARRVMGRHDASLTLISDGLADVGITGVGDLERIASGARRFGITTAAMRIGSGCDEELLAMIARAGGGSAGAAHDPDTVVAALAAGSSGLLEQVVQAASLTVRPTASVDAIQVFDDLPVSRIEEGFIAELGDFCSEERQRLVMKIEIGDMPSLGLVDICELEFQWVDVATLDTHTVKAPVYANLLPGDQQSGRIAVPVAQVERALDERRSWEEDSAEEARLLFDLSARAAGDLEDDDEPHGGADLFPEERENRSGWYTEGEGP